VQSERAIQPPLCRHLATAGDDANCEAELETVNGRDPNPLTNLKRPHLRVESSSIPQTKERERDVPGWVGGKKKMSLQIR
jgi:hypothetical protein